MFFPCKPFQPSLMFDKAGAHPSEVSYSFSTLGQAPGLIHEHQTRLEKLARVLFPSNPFQPSLMFEGKAGADPSEVSFRCSTLGYALGLINEHQTKLEKLASYEHSMLLLKYINYDRKKFFNIGPWSIFYFSSIFSNLLLYSVLLSCCHIHTINDFLDPYFQSQNDSL